MKKFFGFISAVLMLSLCVPSYAQKGEAGELRNVFGASVLEHNWQNALDGDFAGGYPRISRTPEFLNISIDIKTNKPCMVFYAITKSGTVPTGEYKELCRIEKKNKTHTVNISAGLDGEYDIYLKVQREDGSFGSAKAIKNAVAFSIARGDGTPESPYEIYTSHQLRQIAYNPDKHYILENDIKLSGEWSGIETLSGSFDGNGHKILGLCAKTEESDAGLFKEINEGTVKNLYVEGTSEANKNAGLIAGRNEKGYIIDCTVVGDVTALTNNAGGICGLNNGTIENCLATGYTSRAGSYAGGIAGQNLDMIRNCFSAVETVAAEMYAGGIAGTNDGGDIENSIAANVNVYDIMTYNSGKLTTNKHGGRVTNNYCYDKMSTNASYEDEGIHSQAGYDIDFNSLSDMAFFESIGWDTYHWEKAEEGFSFLIPKRAAEPRLEAGKTMYFPKGIGSAKEFGEIEKNPTGHYALVSDIKFSVPFKAMCMLDGFSGTLDGRGYTIHDMNLSTESGMFHSIAGGIVRNLNFKNAKASPVSDGGIITVCNYGYIENCKVYGKITTAKAGVIGGICSENYGEIIDCESYVNIKSTAKSAVIGGVCGDNSGVILDSYYRGSIDANSENAVIGGISGMSQQGTLIFESGSRVDINLEADSGYIGGICGIGDGVQIYKCASSGNAWQESKGLAYMGGIAGTIIDGTIHNCMAGVEIRVSSPTGYSGGVLGCLAGGNVQNTYSTANIVSYRGASTGGICGYSELGFIMQNVALNPEIKTSGDAGAVVASYELSEVSDNFAVEEMIVNGTNVSSAVNDGEVMSYEELKNFDFYYRPVANGGRLGWSSSRYGEDVWSDTKMSGYKLPVLINVKGTESFTEPKYK